MADSNLTLRAKVVDSASPELRRIKARIADIRKTPGMEGLGKQLEGLTNNITRFAKGGGEALLATGALGLSALGAAAGLAELSKKFKDLAARTNNLKELSRETGLTVDQINQLQHVGPRFGATSDQMTKALQTWADKMIDVRRGWGDVVSQLNGQGLGDFVKKLQKDDPAQSVRDIISLLGSPQLMANPALQRRWTEMFFGDAGLTTLLQKGSKGFEQAWAKEAAALDPITKNTVKNADQLRQAIANLNDQMGNLENLVEPPVFKAMAISINASAAALKGLNSGLEALERHLSNPAGAKQPGLFRPLQQGKPGGHGGNRELDDLLNQRSSVQRRLNVMRPSGDQTEFNTIHKSELDQVQQLTDEIRKLREQLSAGGGAGGLVHRMSFDPDTMDGLRQNIAFRTGSSDSGVEQAIERGVFRGLINFENRTALGTAALDAAGPGRAGAPRFTTASYAPSVLGGLRRGGTFGAPPALAPGGAPAPWSTDLKSKSANDFFDSIINAEGTAKRGNPYDTSLGYLKSPKALTSMTNDEVLAWGRHVRAVEGMNSSAKGAFQIENSTQRAAMKALGLMGSAIFNADEQRRMAIWIKQRQGLGAWEGFKIHPDQRARADQAWLRMENGLSDALAKRQPDILDQAAKAGVLHHTVRHEGGADVRVRFEGAPPVKGVSSAASGMVRSIQVNRGTSMQDTREV